MITKKLDYIPYGQAQIEREDNGEIRLRSYATVVVTVSPEGWVKVHGLYSQTTRKHIGAFFREMFGLAYQTARRLYDDDMEYNHLTGEIRENWGE